MDDLVQWLRAQLDQDDLTAGAASWCNDAATWRAEVSKYGTPARPDGPRWYVEDSMEDGVITTVDPQASADEGVARHIAEWDPARAMHEIEAKRQTLAELQAAEEAMDRASRDRDTTRYNAVRAEWVVLRRIVRRDTAVYAGRPGYQEEWRP